MTLNDPWSSKTTICGNDPRFTIVIDDHQQRSTIVEKDGFNGLRAWGRSSGRKDKHQKPTKYKIRHIENAAKVKYVWIIEKYEKFFLLTCF